MNFKILACLALSVSFSSYAQMGEIRERGTDRKIVFEIEKGIATFILSTPEGDRELRQLEVLDANDPRLEISHREVEGFPRTNSITYGYEDLTYWLARNLDMGMVIFGAPFYVGYSLAYLYTVPADLVSKFVGKERRLKSKYDRMLQGKSVKASPRVFNSLLKVLDRSHAAEAL